MLTRTSSSNDEGQCLVFPPAFKHAAMRNGRQAAARAACVQYSQTDESHPETLGVGRGELLFSVNTFPKRVCVRTIFVLEFVPAEYARAALLGTVVIHLSSLRRLVG